MLIGDAFVRWSLANAGVVAENTVIRYRRGIRALGRFGIRVVEDVRRSAIVAYQDARLAAGTAARSINGDVAGLVTLLRWLVRRREISPQILEEAVDAWLPVPGAKVPDFYSRAQYERVVTATSGWLRLAFQVACLSGLRLSELRVVHLEDFDLSRKLLRVRHAKGGRERVVSLCAELVECVTASGVLSGPLFPSERLYNTRSPYRNKDTFQRAMRELTAALGFYCTWHRCRRTFCTWLLRSGRVAPPEVAAMMGHCDLTMIMRHYYVFLTTWNPGIEGLASGSWLN